MLSGFTWLPLGPLVSSHLKNMLLLSVNDIANVCIVSCGRLSSYARCTLLNKIRLKLDLNHTLDLEPTSSTYSGLDLK